MSCFIIAEAGVNHNGSEELALQLIEIAANSGADAVKFQTFHAESLVCSGTEKATYQQRQTGNGDQLSMLKELELSESAHIKLVECCNANNIEFMSTGFDIASIDMLCELGVKRLKLPSGELTNLPYIEYSANKNLPIIMSTGMGTMDEVVDAVECVKATRLESGFNEPLSNMMTLLHCTSSYPTQLSDVNLSAMNTMANKFKLPVGYSDHTNGILISSAAVAMGATVIEKHFTIDQSMAGPDHKASLMPDQLKKMIQNIRDVEESLGVSTKKPTDNEIEMRKLARRSVVMKKNKKAGEIITEDDIVLLRPEGGISPKEMDKVIGKVASVDLSKDQCLTWKDLET